MSKYPLVKVLWYDATADANWHDLDEVADKEPEYCSSVGYLIKQNVIGTILATSFTSDAQCDYLVIPTGCIRSMYKLKEDGEYEKTNSNKPDNDGYDRMLGMGDWY